MYSSVDKYTYINVTCISYTIFKAVLTYIQSQIDILREKTEKRNTYCTEFKDDINKKLEHKSIRERDENETLYERIDLLKKENNCLKNKIKNQQLIIKMLPSNENETTQWKSSKSISPGFLNQPETPAPINLTNWFETPHLAEENSGSLDKNNDVTPKNNHSK